MFEDSTFESTGRIRTRSRGWMMAALLFNASILLTLVLIPLIYPEALPKQMIYILIEAPPPPPLPQPKPIAQTPKQVFHGAPQMDDATLVAPRVFPRAPAIFDEPEGPPPNTLVAMDADADTAANIRDSFRRPSTAVIPVAQNGPLRVPSTLASGLLLEKVLPVYPALAKAAHKEGVVVLQATISTTGTIENLRVISGDPMLRQAALDAVSHWRYRPYLLNGQPVKVETTVNVIFKLNQ